MVFSLIFLAVLVSIWGEFLDKYESKPGHVRAVMFLLLSVIMAVEVGLAATGITSASTAYWSAFVNVWGGFDALLRYPVAHDLGSIFGIKQLLLIAIKTGGGKSFVTTTEIGCCRRCCFSFS